MTEIPFTYKDFENTRDMLIQNIDSEMTTDERMFLVSIQNGTPEWGRLDITGLDSLPALKWKVENVQNMKKEKRENATQLLKEKLRL